MILIIIYYRIDLHNQYQHSQCKAKEMAPELCTPQGQEHCSLRVRDQLDLDYERSEAASKLFGVALENQFNECQDLCEQSLMSAISSLSEERRLTSESRIDSLKIDYDPERKIHPSRIAPPKRFYKNDTNIVKRQPCNRQSPAIMYYI